jgi:hypothetical protein
MSAPPRSLVPLLVVLCLTRVAFADAMGSASGTLPPSLTPHSLLPTVPAAAPPDRPPEIGTLIISAEPHDLVRLELAAPDGRHASSGAPHEDRAALAGTWIVIARAPGYADEQQVIVVSSGDVTYAKFGLQRLGDLSVRGSPRGAAVIVSGPQDFRREGTIPLDLTGVRPGDYDIRASQDGYEDGRAQVTVPAGKHASADLSLRKWADVVPSPAQAPSAADDHETNEAPTRWRISLLTGYVAQPPANLLQIGAAGEWRFSNPVSLFLELAAGVPAPGRAGIPAGIAYAAGLRWYVFRGLHVGVLSDAFSTQLKNEGIESTESAYALDGEVGYVFTLGSFCLGIAARAGYAFVTLSSPDTASGAAVPKGGGFAYGGAFTPGVRF